MTVGDLKSYRASILDFPSSCGMNAFLSVQSKPKTLTLQTGSVSSATTRSTSRTALCW